MKANYSITMIFAILTVLSFISADFEQPSLVSIPKDKVTYVGGHVLTWDNSTNRLYVDSSLADPSAVLGATSGRVIVRLRSLGMPFSVGFSTLPTDTDGAVNFFTIDGGGTHISYSTTATSGQILGFGTDAPGLGTSDRMGQAIVYWTLEKPDGNVLTSSLTKPLPINIWFTSPTTVKLSPGIWTLTATMEVSEFELGGYTSLVTGITVTVPDSTTSSSSASTSTTTTNITNPLGESIPISLFTSDVDPPIVQCTLPLSATPYNQNILVSCFAFDMTGIRSLYGKVNGVTTTSQFIYDNATGKWTYLVPSTNYMIGSSNTFTVTAVDGSERANIKTVRYEFLISDTRGNNTITGTPTPLTTEENLKNLFTPIPTTTKAPSAPQTESNNPITTVTCTVA